MRIWKPRKPDKGQALLFTTPEGGRTNRDPEGYVHGPPVLIAMFTFKMLGHPIKIRIEDDKLLFVGVHVGVEPDDPYHDITDEEGFIWAHFDMERKRV